MHNALVIDGEEQALFDPARLFALPDGARAGVECFEISPAVDRLVAVHHGYERFDPPVAVRRELSLHKDERALVVTEWAGGPRGRTAGVHRVELALQLPDKEVRVRGPRGKERLKLARMLRGGAVDESIAIELGPAAHPRAVVFLQPGVEVALEQSPTSIGYGEYVDAAKVVLRAKVKTPWRWRWVVLFLPAHPPGE